MAGLAAAAALAPRAQRVSVIERDPLPELREATAEAPRRGVPQGRNQHTLLPGGLTALEQLLPGITNDFEAAGANLLDDNGDHRVMAGGGAVVLGGLGPSWVAIAATRPLMEHVVRKRVLSLPNVALRAGRKALGLAPSNGGRAIGGVRLAAGADGEDEGTLEADLVVDATGRGSRTPRWLEDLGYRPPTEQRLQIDARYTTRFFRRGSEVPADRLGVFIAMLPDTYRQAGATVVEGDRWMVSLMGLAGVQAPMALGGFREYARSLWAGDIHDIVATGEPVGEPATGAYPADVWRRYDRLRRLPDRLVVLGDALCSTNPHYVRGMSLAAQQAVTLARVLDKRGPARLGRAFFRATRGLIDAQWTFVTDNDLLQPAVEGPRTPRWRLTTAYAARVMRASHHDPAVARAFMDVFGMLAAPTRLLRPDVLVRTLVSGGERRRGTAPAPAVRPEPQEPAG